MFRSIVFILFFTMLASVLAAQPVVIGHPRDSSICVESSASFRVLALNTAAYQWQENDGVGWYNITPSITYAEGYLTPELRIIDANLGLNGYQYRCVVFDAQNNQAFSDGATLGVYDPPIITMQPAEQRVCKNSIAKFVVVALNGTNYQWQESVGGGWVDLNDNSFYSGTKNDTLSIFTTTGMNGFRYRCKVTHVSCPDYSQEAQLFVDPTPVIFNLTGGGSYCQGGTGVPIGLNESETGISYHLLRNGISTGIVRTGTGTSIDFGLFTQTGDYTVLGINGFTSCQISMNGMATVLVNPLPQQQNLMGGGPYCLGSEEPELYLSGTQSGIEYALLRNGQPTGLQTIGNGFPVSFGQIGQPGTYQVLSTDLITGCQRLMTGSKEVVVNQPPSAFAGADQVVVSGSAVQLSGSAGGGNGPYQFDWNPESYCLNPKQAITGTIPLYITRQFTLRTTDVGTGCQSSPDTVIVRVTDGPLSAYIQSSADRLCPGQQANLTVMASGGSGNYSFQWTSLPPGFIANTQNINVVPEQSTTYVVRVQDGISNVYDTVNIQLQSLPNVFTLSQGGLICLGGAGIELTLSGSESTVTYSLYRDNQLIIQKTGTGSALSFGVFDVSGEYRVKASYADAACEISMNGEATIGTNPKPLADAGNNQIINTGGQTSLNGTGSGGSGNYNYQWSPAEFLLNPGFQNPVTTALNETQVFSVIVTDEQTGCVSQPDQVAVFVSGGNFSLNVFADLYSVCRGESVTLFALPSGGSGNFTYVWQSNPPGFVSSQFNPVVSPQQTTTYYVMVSDGFSIIQDSVQIEVRQSPVLQTLAGGGVYCPNENGRDVYLNQSETGVIYGLMRNGNSTGIQLLGNDAFLSFGNQQIPGSYSANALHLGSGCSATMNGNVVVSQAQSPSVYAGVDRTIGIGSTTLLSATTNGGSGVNSYLWSPPQWVNQPFALQTATKVLLNTTIFNIQATDQQSGCVSLADSVIVYVSGGTLSVQAIASQNTGCLGTAIRLYAIASGGTGNYVYQWTSIPSGFFSNAEQPLVSPEAPTSYVLTVFDGLATSTDTIDINISQPPQIFNISGGGALCNPTQTVNIGLSGSEQGVVYHLELNSQVLSTVTGDGGPVQFGVFSQPGVYRARANYFNSTCNSEMAGQAIISVDAAAVALAGPDKIVPSGGQVTLEGSVQGGTGLFDFQWTPSNLLLNPDALQPTTKPLYNTTVFKLDVSDLQSGCPGTSDYAAVFVQGGNLNMQILASGGGTCPGNPIQLFALPTGGSGNYSYTWVSTPPGFTSQQYDPVFNPVVSTTFKVVVNDGNQLIYDSVFIPVLTGPQQFMLAGSGSYCESSNDVFLELSGSQTGVQYSLFREGLFTGNTFSGTGFPLLIGPAVLSGQYSVQALELSTGCKTTMETTALVEVFATPVADAGPDSFISGGESAVLNGQAFGGSGQYTYQWFPANLLQNPVSQNPATIPLSSSRLFLLRVKDIATGCVSVTDTTVVFVSTGQLGLQVMASAATICAGHPLSLLALPQGGTGQYTVLWKNSLGQVLFNGLSWIDYPTTSLTYYVTVTDGTETISDSVSVQVGAIPAIFSVTGGGSYCNPLSAGLPVGLSGSEAGVVYDLYFNNEQKITSVVGQGVPVQFGYYLFTGNYTVTASYPGYNCSSTMAGSAVIIQQTPPIMSAGPDLVINMGDQAELGMQLQPVSGDYIYSWSPVNLVNNPQNQFTQTVPLQFSVLFQADVTDLSTACSASDEVLVIAAGGPLESSIVASSQIACPGETITLTALPQGGSGTYSWKWSSVPAGFYATTATVSVNPATNTWYKIEMTDNVEVINDSVFIEVYSLPEVFALTGGGVFCFGDPAPIVGLQSSQMNITYSLYRNGAYTGQFRQGNGGPLSFGPQTASGTYTVVATSQSGCNTLMQNQVIVGWEQPPQLFTLLGGGSFCAQDPESSLYLTGSETNTLYQLLLNNEPVNQIVLGTGGPIEFPSVDETGTYTVIASRIATECATTMSGAANLIVFPLPEAQIEGPDFVCTGNEITLTGSGGDQYEWLTDPPVYTKDIIVSPTETTNYILIARNSFGCAGQNEHLVEVGVTPDIAVEINEQLKQIIVTPQGLSLYRFSLAGELLQSGTSHTFYYGNIRTQGDTLYVEAASASGCTAETFVFLERTGNESNAFTPNGDNINDRFMEGEFIRVFSRWGRELYAGSDGWDGKYNGVLVAPGTYYYVHEVKDINGALIRTEKGSVTLVIE